MKVKRVSRLRVEGGREADGRIVKERGASNEMGNGLYECVLMSCMYMYVSVRVCVYDQSGLPSLVFMELS